MMAAQRAEAARVWELTLIATTLIDAQPTLTLTPRASVLRGRRGQDPFFPGVPRHNEEPNAVSNLKSGVGWPGLD
jgi:hypothetical protein